MAPKTFDDAIEAHRNSIIMNLSLVIAITIMFFIFSMIFRMMLDESAGERIYQRKRDTDKMASQTKANHTKSNPPEIYGSGSFPTARRVAGKNETSSSGASKSVATSVSGTESVAKRAVSPTSPESPTLDAASGTGSVSEQAASHQAEVEWIRYSITQIEMMRDKLKSQADTTKFLSYDATKYQDVFIKENKESIRHVKKYEPINGVLRIKNISAFRNAGHPKTRPMIRCLVSINEGKAEEDKIRWLDIIQVVSLPDKRHFIDFIRELYLFQGSKYANLVKRVQDLEDKSILTAGIEDCLDEVTRRLRKQVDDDRAQSKREIAESRIEISFPAMDHSKGPYVTKPEDEKVDKRFESKAYQANMSRNAFKIIKVIGMRVVSYGEDNLQIICKALRGQETIEDTYYMRLDCALSFEGKEKVYDFIRSIYFFNRKKWNAMEQRARINSSLRDSLGKIINANVVQARTEAQIEAKKKARNLSYAKRKTEKGI